MKQIIMPLFLLLIMNFCLLSCKNNNTIKTEHIVKEWIGKTIKFPDSNLVEIINPDTTEIEDIRNKDYKVLIYIDSTGCTKCKLNIHLWNIYIEEYGAKTDFLFYFYPKNKDILLSMLKSEQLNGRKLNSRIYIDIAGEINKLNQFHNENMFQCFLLDKNNKVLLVGNPVHNHKIWELYHNTITGDTKTETLLTTVETEKTEIELKELSTNKTVELVFAVKNIGSHPLIIQRVESSCGCTVPNWEKQPVATGKNTEIKVKITPEEKGYFNKTVTVHCNTEEGQIVLKVSGTVK
jgi:hypothetical protein